jgi:hypothetical protein
VSETAKRSELLENETTHFIEELIAQAVAPPLERFRESAAKTLEGPIAGLGEARAELVRVTGELSARIGSKLDSLQENLDEALADAPRRKDFERDFEALRKEGEERKRLLEGVLDALAQVSAATNAGLAALSRQGAQTAAASQAVQQAVTTDLPRRLEERLGALEAKLATQGQASPQPESSAELQHIQRELAELRAAVSRDLGSLQARLEQVDGRWRASLGEIGRQVSGLRELGAGARESEPPPDRIGPSLGSLESGMAFLQERSQTSMEHFRLLATQVRDLRAEVTAALSQAQLPPARTDEDLGPAIEAVEKRLAAQVRAEAGRLRVAVLLSGGILFLSLVVLLLAVVGRS